MEINRKDALDFLNNSIEYSSILERAEELTKQNDLSSLDDLSNYHLARLCEDYWYSNNSEEEININ